MAQNGDLIQCPRMGNIDRITCNLEHGALLDAVIAHQHIVYHLVALGKASGGQVAQVAHINAQDWHSLTRHPHHRCQQRAVATQRQCHVGFRYLVSFKRRDTRIGSNGQVLQVLALNSDINTP